MPGDGCRLTTLVETDPESDGRRIAAASDFGGLAHPGGMWWTATDTEGHARFEGLPAGKWRVVLEREGGGRRQQDVELSAREAAEVIFTLSGSGPISGR